MILPTSEGFGPRHFSIKFNTDLNSYTIKDLGEGSGTFIKVSTQAILNNGQIVSFGENHLVVGIVPDKYVSGTESSQSRQIT